ncbi:hypothetical protein EIP91_001592 [Steccherinum ochraceum]|uniref:ADP/ATP carrier protein n=1 Tax=Steccherinum ochraceum TaxID=92696 RepID=A0A4R0RHJ1_9APHY|nr:hypothetical protein EIP91_001592 [Steccherinum ochraceum]
MPLPRDGGMFTVAILAYCWAGIQNDEKYAFDMYDSAASQNLGNHTANVAAAGDVIGLSLQTTPRTCIEADTMTSTLPPLVQAVSGSIGSATANAVSYPLDLVATRLQTTSSRFRGIVRALRHIIRSEGWSGMFDGLETDTIAQLLSNFLYFYFYSFLRSVLVRRKTRSSIPAPKTKAKPVLLSVVEELGIGFIAGVASRAISTPLSVVTVRLQTATEGDDDEGEMNAEKGEASEQTKEITTPVTVMRKIYSEEGLTGFWRGFTTTIPLSMNPALTLFLFQLFRRVIARGKSDKAAAQGPTTHEAFFGAAFSNAIATVILYPLMLAKTRLQVHRKEASEKDVPTSENMLTVWNKAYRREGWAGVYQGLEAQILKGFVSQGVTMMVKQRMEMLIVSLYLRHLRRTGTM